ncbi:unnamed protein product, partial [Strongylus vulgaris]
MTLDSDASKRSDNYLLPWILVLEERTSMRMAQPMFFLTPPPLSGAGGAAAVARAYEGTDSPVFDDLTVTTLRVFPDAVITSREQLFHPFIDVYFWLRFSVFGALSSSGVAANSRVGVLTVTYTTSNKYTRSRTTECTAIVANCLEINISLPKRADCYGGGGSGGCYPVAAAYSSSLPSTSFAAPSPQPVPMGARTAMATATWYPQNPQQGNGYLAASVPQARPVANGPCPSTSTYPQPGYPASAASPSSMKMSPNASPYAQYALNYYHQQNLAREREREVYYRSRSMMMPMLPHQQHIQQQPPDWRHY